MKRLCTLILVLCIRLLSHGQGGVWTWMNGSNLSNDVSYAPVRGVPNPAYHPCARYQAVEWTDLNGNFWIFGGADHQNYYYDDLWKYDPIANMWTWVNGPLTPNSPGNYGTQGIPSVNNLPGGRTLGAQTWTDMQGRLWLHGGYGYDLSGTVGQIDDLWVYDISAGVWTWMQGSNTAGTAAVYGTVRTAASGNTPGGRVENNSCWVKSDGTLWTFGGDLNFGYPSNDMWKFDIGINQWTWMSGIAGGNTLHFYGTLNVESAANIPPARFTYSKWQDSTNFYIFGGGDNAAHTFNDLWRYNTVNNLWTWISGDSIPSYGGLFIDRCVPGRIPTARGEHKSTQTPGCTPVYWIFGGSHANSARNDLWNYNMQTQLWTWVSGDSSGGSTGSYGSITVPSPSSAPPATSGMCLWADHSGNLWTFGGIIPGPSSAKTNAVWRFVPDRACLLASGFSVPTVSLSDSFICRGDTAHIRLSGYQIQSIRPDSSLSVTSDSSQILLYPPHSTVYTIVARNSCSPVSGPDTFLYHIRLIPVSIDSSVVSICSNDTFFLAGHPLTSAGVYKDTLTSVTGCDSITIRKVITLPLLSHSTSASICSGNTYPFGGQNISAAGLYHDTLSSVSGCDSIVTLTLTVSSVSPNSISGSICNGNTYLFGGQNISAAGVYRDTLSSRAGCDSIVTLTLIVGPVLTSSIAQSICSGSTYLFGGRQISAAGVYYDTLSSAAGCDSMVTLTLNVSPVLTSSISGSICTGGAYFFGGHNISAAGVYYDTLSSATGCDSIVTLTLSIVQVLNTNVTHSICNGNTYFFAGQNISAAGVYRDTLSAVAGCDSIVTLTLNVSSVSTSNISLSICSGSTYLFDGQQISTAGVYHNTALNAAGCDSTTTLTVSVLPKPIAAFSIAPLGDSIPLGIISAVNTSTDADSIFWLLNNSITSLLRDSVLPIDTGGNYCIRLVAKSSAGCSDISEQCIYVFVNAFIMPNAFTPNGDGKNDLFYPVFINHNTSTVAGFSIYNRWGQLVYNDPSRGWDGSYKGEAQPAGVYNYYVSVNLPDEAHPGQMKMVRKEGSFSLLR